jgi:hypothetical protein
MSDAILHSQPTGSIDRAALMRRAHLIARRFRDVFPTYRQALSYALTTVWADVRARAEHRERFRDIIPRVLTPAERAVSQAATWRCGRSLVPF